MTTSHLATIRADRTRVRQHTFIRQLRAEGVPLAVIAASESAIYIDVRNHAIKNAPKVRNVWQFGRMLGYMNDNMRRCVRFDRLGLIQAVNWYAKKTVYVKP